MLSSIHSVSGSCSGPYGRWPTSLLTTDGVGLQPFEFLITENHRLADGDVVLAQGEAFPGFRHQDAAQVGVAVEPDAEQVPGLALVPVRSGPDRREAGDVWIRHGGGGLDPDPRLVGQRANLPYDGEAGVAGRPIDRCRVKQVIESLLRLEIAGDLDQGSRLEHDAEVAAEVRALLRRRLEAVAEPLHERTAGVHTHLARLQCWRDDPAVRRDA